MFGSSQSLLVRDAAEKLWILKLCPSPTKSNALANELIGARLMAALDIPTPPHAICRVGRDFFEDDRTWFAGGVRPKEGMHFASRYLPCLMETSVLEEIPQPLEQFIARSDSFAMVFAFDVWAMHADRRQALYLTQGSALTTVFIDNGHLFGGPNWNYSNFRRRSTTGRIMPHNSTSEKDIERSITRMQSVLPRAIDLSLTLIPKRWVTGDVAALRNTLHERLGRLETLVWAAYDDMKTEAWLTAGATTASPSVLSTLHSSGQREWVVSAGSNRRAQWM
jgi:hypothetical protein